MRPGGSTRRLTSHAFDEQGEAETAAHAKSREAATQAASLHFVEQRRGDAHARAADGMAEGDGAAVDV